MSELLVGLGIVFLIIVFISVMIFQYQIREYEHEITIMRMKTNSRERVELERSTSALKIAEIHAVIGSAENKQSNADWEKEAKDREKQRGKHS